MAHICRRGQFCHASPLLQRAMVLLSTLILFDCSIDRNRECTEETLSDPIEISGYTFEADVVHNNATHSFAMRWDGYSVVTWESKADGSDHDSGTKVRLLDRDGFPYSNEVPVNPSDAYPQQSPSVSTALDGAFVITWSRSTWNGKYYDWNVFARHFQANATPTGAAFRVDNDSEGTYDEQLLPPPSFSEHNSAMDSLGQFAIVYSSNIGNDDANIYVKTYNSDTTLLSDEFRINQTTTGERRAPSIAMSDFSEMVVSWLDGNRIMFRQCSIYGFPCHPEVDTGLFAYGNHDATTVDYDMDGHIVVAGSMFGNDVHLNSYTASGELHSSIIVAVEMGDLPSFHNVKHIGCNNFVVTYASQPSMDSDSENAPHSLGSLSLYVSQVSSDGAVRLEEAFLPSDPHYSPPGIASNGNGRFAVVQTYGGLFVQVSE